MPNGPSAARFRAKSVPNGTHHQQWVQKVPSGGQKRGKSGSNGTHSLRVPILRPIDQRRYAQVGFPYDSITVVPAAESTSAAAVGGPGRGLSVWRSTSIMNHPGEHIPQIIHRNRASTKNHCKETDHSRRNQRKHDTGKQHSFKVEPLLMIRLIHKLRSL